MKVGFSFPRLNCQWSRSFGCCKVEGDDRERTRIITEDEVEVAAAFVTDRRRGCWRPWRLVVDEEEKKMMMKIIIITVRGWGGQRRKVSILSQRTYLIHLNDSLPGHTTTRRVGRVECRLDTEDIVQLFVCCKNIIKVPLESLKETLCSSVLTESTNDGFPY